MHARFASAVVTAGIAFGWAFTVGAATPNAKAVKPTTAAKPAAASPLAHLLAELHHAKHLLDHANHNYNHHRAKADHEIAKAIHILHPHHAQTAAKPAAKPPATTAHKHVHEAQQSSDAELKHAEHLVKHALAELHQHHGEKAHEAKEHLHHAVREIEQALHVHHVHHNKNAPAVAKN